MKLFKYLAIHTFTLIGGLFLGLSVPIGRGIIVPTNPFVDLLVLAPVGIILIGISFYYKFIHDEK